MVKQVFLQTLHCKTIFRDRNISLYINDSGSALKYKIRDSIFNASICLGELIGMKRVNDDSTNISNGITVFWHMLSHTLTMYLQPTSGTKCPLLDIVLWSICLHIDPNHLHQRRFRRIYLSTISTLGRTRWTQI